MSSGCLTARVLGASSTGRWPIGWMPRGTCCSSRQSPTRPRSFLRRCSRRKWAKHGPDGESDRGVPRRDQCRGLRVDPPPYPGARKPPRWRAWAESRPKRRSGVGNRWDSERGGCRARNATSGPSGCGSSRAGRTGRDTAGVDARRRSVAEASTAFAPAEASTAFAPAEASTAFASAEAATAAFAATAAPTDHHAAGPRVWRQEPHPHRPSRTCAFAATTPGVPAATTPSADRSPSPREGEVGEEMSKLLAAIIAIAALFALVAGGASAGGGTPSGTGQPCQSCQAEPTGPARHHQHDERIRHACSERLCGQRTAELRTTPSRCPSNDVACYQVSIHH